MGFCLIVLDLYFVVKRIFLSFVFLKFYFIFLKG